MKKLFIRSQLCLVVFLLAIFMFFSCREEEIVDTEVEFVPGDEIIPPTETSCGASKNFKLFTAENTEIGNVTIGNDTDSLYITVNTQHQWFFSAIHLYIGEKRNIPVNNNLAPDLSKFPVKTSHNPLVNSYQFSMTLDDYDACEHIVVHMDAKKLTSTGTVLEEKEAWMEGNPLEGISSRGSYQEYCLNECIVKYPVENVATMAFEDLYPEKGDADYNDFVVGMKADLFYKGNKVNRLEMSFEALARGAGYDHKFMLGLPIEGLANITIKRYMSNTTEPYETEELNGVSGTDLRLTIFPSTKQVLPAQEDGRTNTSAGTTYIASAKTTVHITFENAKLLLDAPFDPILYVYETQKEIHLPEVTQDIDADGDGLKDYWEINDGIYPFGIVMYKEWIWPLEQINISRVYPKFKYVYSNGIFRPLDPQWYQTPEPGSKYFRKELFK